MLHRIVEGKKKEVERLKLLEQEEGFPPPYGGKRPSFFKSLLERKGIIAEIKRGSPSLGIIKRSFDVRKLAISYEKNGAVAISIITESEYFFSSPQFLWEAEGVCIPILRKDFIVHPIQIKFTATTPASAILLIARLFKHRCEMLMEMVGYCSLLELEPVVEIFDERDLEIARCAGARVIQVNNRDLDTLKVDLNISREMISLRGREEIWICASGISRREQVEEMLSLGFDACLVGTSLMQREDPASALYELLPAQGKIWMGRRYVP